MRYTTTDGPKKPLNAIQDGSLGGKMGIAGFRLDQERITLNVYGQFLVSFFFDP
jgi:hypothetical protein